MFTGPFAFAASLAVLVWRADAAEIHCKCVGLVLFAVCKLWKRLTLELQAPDDDACWPSTDAWNNLNASVSGKLILNTPPAIVCYPGVQQDAGACAAVNAQWTNATFQSNNPAGLSYPVELSCPPVNAAADETPGTCSIGDLPRYTVNATRPEDIAAAILFAKEHNIRLVVKDTGHDILGRYGELRIRVL
jgi:hypothetical protein